MGRSLSFSALILGWGFDLLDPTLGLAASPSHLPGDPTYRGLSHPGGRPAGPRLGGVGKWGGWMGTRAGAEGRLKERS